MLVIPALGRLRYEDGEFEATLSYIVNSRLAWLYNEILPQNNKLSVDHTQLDSSIHLFMYLLIHLINSYEYCYYLPPHTLTPKFHVLEA
jgi:hypothetical protein